MVEGIGPVVYLTRGFKIRSEGESRSSRFHSVKIGGYSRGSS